jgi:hypothetical protein
MVSARELVGKRIVAFDPGAHEDPEYKTVHTPRITLEDGSYLYFVAEETSDGAYYGTFIGRGK